jgi:hypothetical protein
MGFFHQKTLFSQMKTSNTHSFLADKPKPSGSVSQIPGYVHIPAKPAIALRRPWKSNLMEVSSFPEKKQKR